MREEVFVAEQSLAQKLGVKPGHRLLILNAPGGYLDQLKPLPEGTTLHTSGEGQYDLVQLFVHNKADIDAHAPSALESLREDGLFWVAYPKQSSKMKTDINRDVGWETVKGLGLDGVKQIAIDALWSALRFRPAEKIVRRGKMGQS
jgi:hypothetical protein